MLTVRDLWSVYDLPRPTGRGETLGILGEGDARGPIADLREFEQLESLPQVQVRVVHADGPRGSYDDTRGRDEWSMDLEGSTGMAPSVRQATLYFGGSLFNVSLLNDIAAWASDARGPRQASMSITECEDTPLGAQTGGFTATPEFVVPADRLLRQAAIEGRTLFAASGDLGSSCPIVPVLPINGNGVVNEGAPVVGYPAASPYAVAVGGTVLYASFGANPRRVLETGWTASGGGQSVTSPQPAYQRAVAPPGLGARPCVQKSDGSSASATVPCRMVPDVAALSGDVLTNGLAIVRNGAPNQVGAGTSLSAPLWAGIWARVQSGRPPAFHRGFGFADPALYRVATTAFVDIGGGPTSPPTSNGAYVTMPGYDYVTGLGVPDVAALLRSLSRKAA
jgi:subtilase family serine protease